MIVCVKTYRLYLGKSLRDPHSKCPAAPNHKCTKQVIIILFQREMRV